MKLEQEALVLHVLAKQVYLRLNEVKRELDSQYASGDSRKFRSPVDDAKLGIVYRQDRDPEWRVTDQEAFTAHMQGREHGTWTVRTLRLPDGYEVELADVDELCQVLREHAPHMLGAPRKVLNSVMINDLLRESLVSGTAAAPGISRVKPAGSLVVRPATHARRAVEAMVAAGAVNPVGLPISAYAERISAASERAEREEWAGNDA